MKEMTHAQILHCARGFTNQAWNPDTGNYTWYNQNLQYILDFFHTVRQIIPSHSLMNVGILAQAGAQSSGATAGAKI